MMCETKLPLLVYNKITRNDLCSRLPSQHLNAFGRTPQTEKIQSTPSFSTLYVQRQLVQIEALFRNEGSTLGGTVSVQTVGVLSVYNKDSNISRNKF